MNITAKQLELISDALIFALSEGQADEKDVLHITNNIESFLSPYKQNGTEAKVIFEIKKCWEVKI